MKMMVAEVALRSLTQAATALTSGLSEVNATMVLVLQQMAVSNQLLERACRLLDELVDETVEQTDHLAELEPARKKAASSAR
jgi:hypothetical protein